jgi:hypothetical protein
MNGGFRYSPFNQKCYSGPAAPSDYYDGPIQVSGDKLQGGCRGRDGSPSWGSDECCKQICEIYGPNLYCKLKPEFQQLLEKQIGPIAEYKEKKTVEPVTLGQLYAVSPSVWNTIAIGLFFLIFLVLLRHKSIKALLEFLKQFVKPTIRKIILAIIVFLVIAILGGFSINYFPIVQSTGTYIPQMDAKLSLGPNISVFGYLQRQQPLVVYELLFSMFFSLFLLSYFIAGIFTVTVPKKETLHVFKPSIPKIFLALFIWTIFPTASDLCNFVSDCGVNIVVLPAFLTLLLNILLLIYDIASFIPVIAALIVSYLLASYLVFLFIKYRRKI